MELWPGPLNMETGVNWIMYFTYHTCLLSRCGHCRWGGRAGARRLGGSRRRTIRVSEGWVGVSWGSGVGDGGGGHAFWTFHSLPWSVPGTS